LGAVVHPEESDGISQGKVTIPYLTMSGPVGLRFRALPGMDGPKYYAPAGSKLTIFNVNQFTIPKGWIVITEGEIDCITAVQAGLPAVGLPGVSSWRDYYRLVFDGYERVIILADADDKGQGQGFAEKIAEHVPAPAIFPMPDGHDVNSFVKEHGADALFEHLKIKR
jgi:DNA primase